MHLRRDDQPHGALPGDSEIDQLFRIFRVLGTPDDGMWPSVSTLPDYKAQFPQWKAKPWEEICPALGEDGLDLLRSLLRYAPHERISARDACSHRFFDDYEPAREAREAAGGREVSRGAASEGKRERERATRMTRRHRHPRRRGMYQYQRAAGPGEVDGGNIRPWRASVDDGGEEQFGDARGLLESCDGRERLASEAPRRGWAPREKRRGRCDNCAKSQSAGERHYASDRDFARVPSLVVVGFSSLPRLSRQWKMHTAPLDDDKVTSYYEPFYGHDVEHLALALSALRRRHDSVVFLAGDSSLDNKYWFSSWADAVNGYETVLEPPRMKRDVCYWINEQAEREGKRLGCLNAAVEATSLNDRAWGRLLPQDAFIRDHITEDDVLVVSVGGNDVALSPLLCTAVNLAVLVCCVPRPCLERGACASPPNVNALVDCGCCGCGVPGCVAGLWGWPPGASPSPGRARHASISVPFPRPSR